MNSEKCPKVCNPTDVYKDSLRVQTHNPLDTMTESFYSLCYQGDTDKGQSIGKSLERFQHTTFYAPDKDFNSLSSAGCIFYLVLATL